MLKHTKPKSQVTLIKLSTKNYLGVVQRYANKDIFFVSFEEGRLRIATSEAKSEHTDHADVLHRHRIDNLLLSCSLLKTLNIRQFTA